MLAVLYAVFHASHVCADASIFSHFSVVYGCAPVFNIMFVTMWGGGSVCDQVITCTALGFLLVSLNCVYVLHYSFAVRLILLYLVLEHKDVDCVQSASD